MQPIELILEQLKQAYPDAHCALFFSSPHELMVATILSAQCTDERVNQVTQSLFKKYRSPQAFADADLAELEQDVRSTGFFRNKAASIKHSAQQLLELHQGLVPNQMKALTALSGVGRKTANVIMGNAFGYAEGVVVDTHVSRLSQRLGLTQQTQPEKIEKDLMAQVPEQDWVLFPHLMISHGRAVCKARKPLCKQCCLRQYCPSEQAS
ncbi:endonuclease III [bacterium (Candidatus Blackallbacteria) CG17_big_fil_post_rev_8_21_14_2_50_48_46]|uniref:Endonuclease III n=1 Tax=bacterium (Candidatus Blackallbacteria) CG17_big_fil_post_rev_8_21_14_2_50_48_46 TaxID=2014261 RepID=A0A2M7GB35_9BACT|nr:MAG: endonuclease III [bacterium (Candidatus Blackallbacteria) CG18_big_fil_WC_8_21_14_2_50_49_26]PIW19378.1 MAG: endonuclease III [bacterium (Candidatus Blackallbacteria) CG17_big_fil_post_rev_8_21_14_2_50_48_46]PIW49018.1 MAG: endonuclease III [bacterium (Candidatus Blackallbacteria) CG13_big_fil_rev_8_21_14_2_50_49_14]